MSDGAHASAGLDVYADLAAKLAAATPGPWDRGPGELFACNDSGDLLFDYRDAVLVEDHPEGVAQCEADADLIVAAVNAAPDLLAEVEQLRAERDGLRAQVAAVEALAEKLEASSRDLLDPALWEHDGLATRMRSRGHAKRDDAYRIRAALAEAGR